MSLETFYQAYVECALWSSNGDDEQPLDKDHDPSDLADDTREAMRRECEAFYVAHEPLWSANGWSDDQAGHDFWLTRCGHGAGFWDRNCDTSADRAVGKRLTDEAHNAGNRDLYIGDDGKIYQS